MHIHVAQSWIYDAVSRLEENCKKALEARSITISHKNY